MAPERWSRSNDPVVAWATARGLIRVRRREPRIVPLSLEGQQTPETVKQYIEIFEEKLPEATDEELATVIVDPAHDAATQCWETETDHVTKVVETSEQLKDGVTASLQRVGDNSGLPPGAADFTAGVATNLILAPIMGPLDKAETYIEVAGIIIGITMGAHGLALACAKLLLKRQSERVFEQGVMSLLQGPRTAQPHSDASQAASHQPHTATDSPPFKHPESVAHPTAHDREQHGVVPPAHFLRHRTRRERGGNQRPTTRCGSASHSYPSRPPVRVLTLPVPPRNAMWPNPPCCPPAMTSSSRHCPRSYEMAICARWTHQHSGR